MLSVWMILTAIAVLSFSGLPACLFSLRSNIGQRLATSFMFAGSAIGLCGIALCFNDPVTPALSRSWFLPWGQFAIKIDAISMFFLVPVLVVPMLGSIYGLSYWKQSEHPKNGRQVSLFYGLLAGAMALIVIAQDAVLFLIAWEIMALSAYFCATCEDDNPEVCKAGWIYLVATHLGTLCLIAMFALLRQANGSFALNPLYGISPYLAGTIFVLSLIGFGFKAGIMPLHVWLPGAHANAPSHVSAVMSGVMLKMGIYGIVRMTSLLEVTSAWWGGIVLVLGIITGVAGIAFAICQSDIKRILAYSSIENIGIIMIGLGLALLGKSQNQELWVILGLGGAMLHVWNHSLFKSLLFFNAGAIIHACNTRNIDQMGGFAKRMPLTMILFVIGAVAICALPPLNGFVSEWLIYSGLFHTLNFENFTVVAIAAVPLAMIGALAVACFVKMTGTVFLGSCRSKISDHAHDPSASMMISMAVLAAGCIFVGLFPTTMINWLDRAVAAWGSISDQKTLIATATPLIWITRMSVTFILLVAIIVLALKKLMTNKVVNPAVTWDCGYAKATARIQYTGSSFSQTLLNMFGFIVWPKIYLTTVNNVFPKAAWFKTVISDTVLDRMVMPAFKTTGKYIPWLRILQQGQTHLYVLYILIIVIILLICGWLGV